MAVTAARVTMLAAGGMAQGRRQDGGVGVRRIFRGQHLDQCFVQAEEPGPNAGGTDPQGQTVFGAGKGQQSDGYGRAGQHQCRGQGWPGGQCGIGTAHLIEPGDQTQGAHACTAHADHHRRHAVARHAELVGVQPQPHHTAGKGQSGHGVDDGQNPGRAMVAVHVQPAVIDAVAGVVGRNPYPDQQGEGQQHRHPRGQRGSPAAMPGLGRQHGTGQNGRQWHARLDHQHHPGTGVGIAVRHGGQTAGWLGEGQGHAAQGHAHTGGAQRGNGGRQHQAGCRDQKGEHQNLARPLALHVAARPARQQGGGQKEAGGKPAEPWRGGTEFFGQGGAQGAHRKKDQPGHGA